MLTRRAFVRYSGLGALALAMPGRVSQVRAALAEEVAYACDLQSKMIAAAAAGTAAAPPPFTRALVQPSTASPSRQEADRDVYALEMKEAQARLLEDRSTTIWGYDGQFPGPTIKARPGREVVVEQTNSLTVPTVVHLHGANVPPGQDGHPNDVIAPGTTRRYHYGNRQRPATLWYHDHRNHNTGEQVYRGLAGAYVLLDASDRQRGLPDGERDLVLLLTDKTFADDGSLVYSTGVNHNGFFGEVLLVNGVPQPYLEVERTTYRVRVVNASNARPYALKREDGVPLTVIGSDGGLLAEPVQTPTVELYPAERAEFLFDFSRLDAGTSVVLGNDFGPDIMRFDVTGSVHSPAPLSSPLSTVATLPAPVATREVLLTFDPDTGRWVLNGHGFDPDRYDARPRLDTVERWRLINDSTHTHPIHPHLVMFQVRSRKRGTQPAGPPDVWERGWKDTVRVRPGETVELDARFADFTGTYVYHCHILEHEDHDMMSQFRVVDLQRLAGPGRVETAAAVSAATFSAGIPAAFVATGDGFADALAAGPVAGSLGAPVLVTRGTKLSDATADELRRLRPGRIEVLGGPNAIPDSVVTELQSLTEGEVTRVAGSTRWATAAAVSKRAYPTGAEMAFVANGLGFADALAGGAAAAQLRAPLLLTLPDIVPSETSAELRRLDVDRIVVLGGEIAVTPEVVSDLGKIAPVERLAGDSRYATAAVVARRYFDRAETILVATGEDYPDALAGVPAAAAHGAPLLLVARDQIPAATSSELSRLHPSRILVLGGPAAVSESVQRELDDFLTRD